MGGVWVVECVCGGSVLIFDLCICGCAWECACELSVGAHTLARGSTYGGRGHSRTLGIFPLMLSALSPWVSLSRSQKLALSD